MVVSEGNKGVFSCEGNFVIYCQDQGVKRNMLGEIVELRAGTRVTNSSWTQIVSGKLTQWSDY